jgi:hypothetical protein
MPNLTNLTNRQKIAGAAGVLLVGGAALYGVNLYTQSSNGKRPEGLEDTVYDTCKHAIAGDIIGEYQRLEADKGLSRALTEAYDGGSAEQLKRHAGLLDRAVKFKGEKGFAKARELAEVGSLDDISTQRDDLDAFEIAITNLEKVYSTAKAIYGGASGEACTECPKPNGKASNGNGKSKKAGRAKKSDSHMKWRPTPPPRTKRRTTTYRNQNR